MRLLRRRTSRGGPWGPLSPTRLVPQLLQSICQLLHSGDIHQPLQKLRMSSVRSPQPFSLAVSNLTALTHTGGFLEAK